MEEKKFYYRMGLDIGIASVGWAVLQNNSQDEPVHIIDMGVRIFDKAEQPKTGESLAGPRRAARSSRRRLGRRKHRLDRIKYLLQQEGLIQIDTFMERYHSADLPNVYQLRYEALDRKLSGEELAQALIHIAKHRGFQSNRKAELKEDANGKVLKATSENEVLMKEKGYRTVGEMMYCDISFKTPCACAEGGYLLTPRNKAEDYRHTILRAMLVEEVKKIFACQRSLGNEKATEKLEEKYLEIMTSQRSFDMGPGFQSDGTPSPYAMEGFADKVGKCTLEPEENRAAKATYTAELFVALQKINNLRLVRKSGESRFLTKEEREPILELLHNQREVSYAAVRKRLNLAEEDKFNSLNYSAKSKDDTEEQRIRNTEKAKFVSMPNYYEYKKRIGYFLEGLQEEEIGDLFDKIGTILTLYKNDDSRTTRLKELGLEQEDIEKLLELSPTKFQHLSLKAMKKVIPFLKGGMTYDKACEAAGYDFKADGTGEKLKILKGEEITSIINDITNPVVKRSVSQTVKVINGIIQKYGSPQAINIELAREMSKNFQERQKMDRQMKERGGENEKIKKEIQELGIVNPTGQDIIKYRLWQEQQHICLYSGKTIPLDELFKPGYDIDHILPYSITFDDSYRNKVLVTSQENRQKGNRTPYEYFGQDTEKWNLFETNVNRVIGDYRKRQKLLKQTITKEDREQFKERNLNDTKYITTVVYNMIRKNLEMEPFFNPEKKKHVTAVNGAITSYLRKRWGLQPKNRETDTHHAVDAVIVACCTDGMIHKISRSSQARETEYAQNGQLLDYETGEVFNRDEWNEKYGAQVPRPWHAFKTELDVRMGTDPRNFLLTHFDVAREIDYPVEIFNPGFLEEKSKENPGTLRPIFVSRMPNHKVTGAAHADTIRSAKYYKEGGNGLEKGYVVTKTPLKELKLNKDGEIDGYFNPESDWLLYNAIKRQLEMYGNDGKKAFAGDFHKPRADGSEGPIVRKVKIYKKLSLGVAVNGGAGIAENGSMVRIDVFRENGKYYFVPIYTADVVKKVLPNRASTAYRPYEEWREMDDSNFLFSLYSRDLIHIKSKKGIKMNLVGGGQILDKEIYAYYVSAGISTASISGIAHDSSSQFVNLGIQSLELLEKCQVDVLGNISVVKSERRMGF